MNDEDLLRYSRHILLPWFGVAGQERLRAARALILGVGGLGSPVALYLAAAGVGELTLVDPDRVDLANLQRQIAHTTADIGRPKVASATERIAALNPAVRVRTLVARLVADDLRAEVARASVVLDCTDNFTARFAINAACVAERVPLVSGAVIRAEGQVTVFPNDGGGPCYRCLYPEEGEAEERCTENGVLASVPGIIGAVQSTEALKLLSGCGETLGGRLLLLDALTMRWREIAYGRDPGCPVCALNQTALTNS